MSRKVVDTKNAPGAVGPYSQACGSKAGKTLYLSGQIPIDPANGEMVQGPASVQAVRCMDNLSEVLHAAGLDFGNVLRCTIFLTDMADFGSVNDIYGRYFEAPYPARACVQVAALPKGALVEVDAIAERD